MSYRMDIRAKNELDIRAIRNALTFSRDQLRVYKQKIPTDLDPRQGSITFKELEERFRKKEASQKKSLQYFGQVEAELCTMEFRLEQNDGSSWCGFDDRIHRIETVNDWLMLSHEKIDNAIEYAETNLKLLDEFKVGDYGDQRAGELLSSAKRLGLWATSNLANADEYTYLVLPEMD